MKRTQIYLEDETYGYLISESQKSGKTMSEVIREIIKSDIDRKRENLLELSGKVFGIWNDKDFDTNEYLLDLRSSSRLHEL
ncbi:MAG: hypothetical protein HQK89_11120 [Nitrospirae bacterium]|nr:hypothetical protein [Nitrospirota bacterium]